MAVMRKIGKKLPTKARTVKCAPVKTSRPVRLTGAVRQKFLDMLAETSNVSASAKAAGIHTGLIYAERRKNPTFMAEWTASLAEGYARLEAGLLAEALQMASGKICEVTLKSRAQKHRLALALLSAHRASVKGVVVNMPISVAKGGMTKVELLAKLTDMKSRQTAAALSDLRGENGTR